MNRAVIRMSLALALGLSLSLLAFMLLRRLEVSPSVARAAGFSVCPAGPPMCEYSSIQAAVDAAGDGDIIKVAAGTYTDLHQRTPPGGYVGPSVITQVIFIDKSVTIRGGYDLTFIDPPDSKANPTTIDAQGQGRGIFMNGDNAPVIEGLQITGGQAAGLGGVLDASDGGGGVYVISATATFMNNRIFSNTVPLAGGGMFLVNDSSTLVGNQFLSNTAGVGGGLGTLTSTTIISDNTFINNRAEPSGGGLFVYSSQATLTNNLISTNSVSDDPDLASRGGGLYIFDSLVGLTDNTITANTAFYEGGGIFVFSSTVTLTENLITANSVEIFGGGLYLWEGNSTLHNNTISHNNAEYGGGLHLENETTQLNGNIITGNRADYFGGLDFFYNDLDKEATLVNNIIADNQADISISGLSIQNSSGNALAHLAHTTIARNQGGDGIGIYLDGKATLTNTILVSQTVGITTSADSDAVLNGVLWFDNDFNTGGAGAITVTNEYTGQPRFADPDAGNYHLRSGSAALDRGVDAGITTDIDGEARPYDEGFDLGADEGQPGLTISKVATPAIAQAGAPLTYTIRLTNSDFITLTATITDILPAQVTPSGVRVWSPTIAPGNVWTEQVVVTVEMAYEGPLTNVVQVSSEEGMSGDDVHMAPVGRVYYLPVIFRED